MARWTSLVCGVMLLAFAAPLGQVHAQDEDHTVTQAGRVEIQATRRDSWEVIPLGEEGLLLLGSDKRGGELTLSRYNTAFQPVWTQDYTPEGDATVQSSWVDGGAVWFLLHRPRSAELTLLRVDLQTGATAATPVRSPSKARDTGGLLVHGDDAYIEALTGAWDLFRGSEGALLHVSLSRKVVQVMDVAAAAGVDELLLSPLVSGPGPDDISLTGAVDARKHRTLYLMSLQQDRIARTLVLAPDEGDDRNLLRATPVALDGQHTLVVGTYASGRKDYHSQGLYLAGFDGLDRSWIRYHSFSTFQHFFDYLPDGQRARIERRIERKADDDQDLDLNYLLRLHAPMVLSDRIVLVGEAFHPQYHTYTTTATSTVNGVTTTTTTVHTVFDGYRYTHAVVAAFSLQGDLLWDASVPIGNVLSPTVRDQVAVSVQGDHIHMLYCVAGKVYSLEADGDAIHGEKASQRLEGEGEDAEVRASWGSHSAWWYDDWFLVWGYERVRGDGDRRTVFAFTKVGPGDAPE